MPGDFKSYSTKAFTAKKKKNQNLKTVLFIITLKTWKN